MPSLIIQGQPLRLVPPEGFLPVQAVAPSVMEEYRREQPVLALYVDECHLGRSCADAAALLDPFVEVLMPEQASFVREMTPDFFESCKFEVAQKVLGHGWNSAVVADGDSPQPLGRFADGPGWYSCCTLRYRHVAKEKGEALLLPVMVGNVVFLLNKHPVIVNLHRRCPPDKARQRFDWLTRLTRSYRGELLRLNGLV